MVSKFALPYLLKGENAHVLNLAPPIDLHPTWFKLGGTYDSKCAKTHKNIYRLEQLACSEFQK